MHQSHCTCLQCMQAASDWGGGTHPPHCTCGRCAAARSAYEPQLTGFRARRRQRLGKAAIRRGEVGMDELALGRVVSVPGLTRISGCWVRQGRTLVVLDV